MKRITTWLFRLLILLIALQVVYLVVANIALNQAFVKDKINQIRPERFQIEWEQLRSYFPTHINVTEFVASGETPSSRWKVSGSRASARLDLKALSNRILRTQSGDLEDVKFTFERKSESEKAKWAKKPAAGKRNKWVVDAGNLSIKGAHTVTMPKGQVQFNGNILGSLEYIASSKLLTIHGGDADLKITSLNREDGTILSEEGAVKGSFEMLPFVPVENRGKKSLQFLKATADVTIESNDISFLNPYIERFKGMALSGKGKVGGRIFFDQGLLASPTELQIVGAPLELTLLRLKVAGGGTVDLKVEEQESEELLANVQFSELVGYDLESGEVLAEGTDLSIEAVAPNLSLLEKPKTISDGSIVLSIPQLTVPDIQVYQKYIPEKLRFALLGGSGYLDGTVSLGVDSGSVNLSLKADDASVEMGKFQFLSGLELTFALDSTSFVSPNLDISGTALKLTDAILRSETEVQNANPVPFSVELNIEKGVAILADVTSRNSAEQWVQMVKNKQTKELFANSEVDASITGSVSNLHWIEQFVHKVNGFEVDGAGRLSARIMTREGSITSGSRLVIEPENLSAGFLDYQILGEGSVIAEVTNGGKAPDVSISVNFLKGALKRRSDTTEFANITDAQLIASIRELDLDAPINNSDLRILLPSARVIDMTVYNSFLPQDAPLKLLSGEAEMNADLKIGLNQANGRIQLETEKMKAAIDNQSVAARLRLEVDITGGDPSQMRFNISGSKIQLDQILVEGNGEERQSWRDGEWLGEVVLTKGLVQWRKPIDLDLEADLHLDDTRPFVAILSNHTGRRDWLEKLLSVEDVKGIGEMTLRQNEMRFPMVFVDAGDVMMGAKGLIDGTNREGVVYARYKKLNGLLRIAGKRRGFDLLKARMKFDQYAPGNPLFKSKKVSRSASRADKDTLRPNQSKAWKAKGENFELEAGARP